MGCTDLLARGEESFNLLGREKPYSKGPFPTGYYDDPIYHLCSPNLSRPARYAPTVALVKYLPSPCPQTLALPRSSGTGKHPSPVAAALFALRTDQVTASSYNLSIVICFSGIFFLLTIPSKIFLRLSAAPSSLLFVQIRMLQGILSLPMPSARETPRTPEQLQ